MNVFSITRSNSVLHSVFGNNSRYVLLLKVVMVFIVTSSFTVNGQNQQDSLRLKKAQDVNKNFPYAHMVDFQYTYYSPSKIKTRIKGTDLLDTKVNFQQWLTTSINLPLFVSPKFIVVNSFRYQYATTHLEDPGTDMYRDIRGYLNESETSNSYSEALNLVYLGKLFNKRLTCNVNAVADFSDHGYERINGRLAVSLEIKHTDRTSVSIGLLGNTDPMSTTPVIPLITLSHWFGSKYYLDCMAPAYLYLRRVYANKSRLSIGGNLSGYQSFSHPAIPAATSFTYQRGKAELAAIYEKHMGAGFNLSSKIGYVLNLRDKVVVTNSDNAYTFVSQKPNFSINIGVTYDLIPKKYRKAK